MKLSGGFTERTLVWDFKRWKISFSCSLLISQSIKISNSEFLLFDFRDSICNRFTCFSCVKQKVKIDPRNTQATGSTGGGKSQRPWPAALQLGSGPNFQTELRLHCLVWLGVQCPLLLQFQTQSTIPSSKKPFSQLPLTWGRATRQPELLLTQLEPSSQAPLTQSYFSKIIYPWITENRAGCETDSTLPSVTGRPSAVTKPRKLKEYGNLWLTYS